MPGMVDPAIPLADFQKAIKKNQLPLIPCKSDPSLLLHFDQPEGHGPRLTFAKIVRGEVMAFVMFSPGDPYKGLTAFSVGIATPKKYRRQGRARAILGAAIEEMKIISSIQKVEAFYVDAVVSIKNTASLKLSESFFVEKGMPVTDHASGEPSLQFFMKVTVG